MLKDHKKAKIIFAALVFGLYAVYSCVGAPLYDMVGNNALLNEGMLPPIISGINTLIELSVYVIVFATLTYFIINRSLSSSYFFVITYVCALVFKYLANYLVMGLMYSYFYLADLKFYLLYVVIELVQLGILIICLASIRNACAPVLESGRSCFPFKKLFDLKNPTQLGAFISALMICVPKIISRIIYDFSIGAPEDLREVLTMVGYYTFDIFMGVLEYFVIIRILMLYDHKICPKEA